MKKIKFSYIILTISLCAVVLLSLHIYKQRGYKQSIEYLFGKDNYIVEAIENDDDYTKIYTLDNKDVNGFEVLEDYMNGLGYFNLPDKQYAVFYYFQNENGDYANVEGYYENRGYIEWYILWEPK